MLRLLNLRGSHWKSDSKELWYFQTGFDYQGKDSNEVSQVKSTETDPYSNINIIYITYVL